MSPTHQEVSIDISLLSTEACYAIARVIDNYEDYTTVSPMELQSTAFRIKPVAEKADWVDLTRLLSTLGSKGYIMDPDTAPAEDYREVVELKVLAELI